MNSGIYTTKLTAARNGRLLRCTVKDGYGNTLTSDTVSMRLYQFAITSHPMDQVGLENDSLTFSITAQGDGLTYQWQYSDNGGAKWATSNVKTSTYTTRLYASRNGRLVRCIVTDAYGTALTSDAASMRLYELAITTQPVSCVANENDTVTFTVAAHGTGLVYQWQYSDNGGARWINSLVKTPVYTGKLTATRNGRLLRCIVSDAYGDSVISEIVSMKLYQLAITTQPTDCSALENATVTFHVAAAGDGLTYQWQYSDNGVAKWANSSVNTDTYTGKLTATRNGRLVRCIVTDAYGSTVISDSAVMKLYQLTITTQPVDCVRHENEEVTFTVAAQGDGLTYQWQYSDNDGATWRKSSVTNASYTAKLTAAKDGRLVRCIVSDAYGGTVTSDSACMKLYQLSITRQPQDYVGAENSVTNIFLEAEGEGLTYQWQFSDNGGKKWSSSSVDDPVYAARLTAAKDGRLVRCIVTDAYGDSVISKSARMKIYRLRITTQPVDCITTVNSMVTFFVSAEGEGLTYQWQYSDNGGKKWTTSSIKTAEYPTMLAANRDGRQIRCIVKDQYGNSVTSDVVTMRLYKLAITKQPVDYVGKVNSTASFTVEAVGVGLTYKWQYSDNGGQKWTTSSVSTPTYSARLTSAKNGRLVRCIITDAYDKMIITDAVSMRVGAFHITEQPQSVVAKENSTVTFKVAADGEGLTYKWQYSDNGGQKWTTSSVTSSIYSARLTAAKNGRLVRCIITDANGNSVTSGAARMTIG